MWVIMKNNTIQNPNLLIIAQHKYSFSYKFKNNTGIHSFIHIIDVQSIDPE